MTILSQITKLAIASYFSFDLGITCSFSYSSVKSLLNGICFPVYGDLWFCSAHKRYFWISASFTKRFLLSNNSSNLFLASVPPFCFHILNFSMSIGESGLPSFNSCKSFFTCCFSLKFFVWFSEIRLRWSVLFLRSRPISIWISSGLPYCFHTSFTTCMVSRTTCSTIGFRKLLFGINLATSISSQVLNL